MRHWRGQRARIAAAPSGCSQHVRSRPEQMPSASWLVSPIWLPTGACDSMTRPHADGRVIALSLGRLSGQFEGRSRNGDAALWHGPKRAIAFKVRETGRLLSAVQR